MYPRGNGGYNGGRRLLISSPSTASTRWRGFRLICKGSGQGKSIRGHARDDAHFGHFVLACPHVLFNIYDLSGRFWCEVCAGLFGKQAAVLSVGVVWAAAEDGEAAGTDVVEVVEVSAFAAVSWWRWWGSFSGHFGGRVDW